MQSGSQERIVVDWNHGTRINEIGANTFFTQALRCFDGMLHHRSNYDERGPHQIE